MQISRDSCSSYQGEVEIINFSDVRQEDKLQQGDCRVSKILYTIFWKKILFYFVEKNKQGNICWEKRCKRRKEKKIHKNKNSANEFYSHVKYAF